MSESKDVKKQENEKLQMVNRFLTMQEKEIDLKRKEVDLSSADLENQKEIALANLDAHVNDRECERNFILKQSKNKLIGVLVFFIAISIFLVTLIMLGKDDLAKTLIEDAVKILLGGVAGYGYKTIKSSKDAEKD